MNLESDLIRSTFAGLEVALAVSCVEEARWSHRPRPVSNSRHMHYALDALDSTLPNAGECAGHDAVQALLKDAQFARREASPAVGEGTDVRFAGGACGGGALVARGRVVHLYVFPTAMVD